MVGRGKRCYGTRWDLNQWEVFVPSHLVPFSSGSCLVPFCSVSPSPVVSRSVPSCSISSRPVPFRPILSHSILYNPAPYCPVLLQPILSHPIPSHSFPYYLFPSRAVPSRTVHLSNSIEPHAVPSRIRRNGIEAEDGTEINSTELDRTGRAGKKRRLNER